MRVVVPSFSILSYDLWFDSYNMHSEAALQMRRLICLDWQLQVVPVNNSSIDRSIGRSVWIHFTRRWSLEEWCITRTFDPTDLQLTVPPFLPKFIKFHIELSNRHYKFGSISLGTHLTYVQYSVTIGYFSLENYIST